MAEPTDFKNREYRMLRGTYDQLFQVMRQMLAEGWQPEEDHPEWVQWRTPGQPPWNDKKRIWVLPLSRPKGMPWTEALYGANPNCSHMVVDAPGGGVKCVNCPGWFCY